MHKSFKFRWIFVTVFNDFLQIPETLNKSLTAFDRITVPRCSFFKVTDKHFIKAHCICTVLVNNFIRVNNIAPWLWHLFTVLTENHTVWCTLLIWLFSRNNTDVIKEFMPETRIEKVQSSMLHTTVIPIYRAPIFCRFFWNKFFIIVRVHIS